MLRLRKWLVHLCVEILEGLYEKIRGDISFCPHGYIAVTCEQCRNRNRPAW
jgi:hypothetical protein